MSWWKNDPLAEEATTSKWWESDPIADVELPEEEAAPSFADEAFAVPEPSRDVAPDETDSRRASRGLGRSAYLDDGSLPDLDINNPTPRRVPAAEGVRTAGVDPFAGEGMGALAKRRGQQFARGATEVAASLPEASAISSAQVEATQVEEAKKLLARRAEQITDLEARLQRDLPDEERRFVEQQISDLQAGQEELRRRASAEVKPAGERERFARGDALRQRSEDIFGAPDPRDTSFWAAVAEGAGNMTALAATSMVPGGVVAGATLGAGLNKSQVYKEAIAAGADEETAQKAANWGAVIGATEIVPISRALKALPPRLRPKITNRVLRKFSDIAQGAGEEAAQEYLATVANNIVAQNIYDPERGWTEGATESALVGAVLGGALGGVGGAGSARYREDDDPDRPNSPRLTPEDRQSPIPNDVIDDGKKIMEEAVSPRKPSDGIPPLPQGGADVRTPDTDFRRPNPVPPLRTEQPAAAPQPPQEPQPAAPQGVTPETTETASERRLGEPFPEVDGDVDTGRIVQLDLDTGEVIEAGSQNAQASIETDVETPQVERPSPLDTVATEGLPTAPPVAAPSQPKKKPAKPTVMKRPLANTMKQYGVKPGPPLAKELAARDINARTHPGLFRSDGRSDWDNIAADTFGEMAAEIGEDGQGYLSQEGLIEALERETVGVLLPVGEQAELRAARDAKEAEARFEEATPDPDPIDLSAFAGANAYIPPRNDDISTDAERMDMVDRSLRGVLTETSLDGVLTDTEVNTIRNRLTENGGNVEDAVWSQIYRSADSADPITEGTGARDAEGGSPAVAGADGKGSGEPAIQPRAEAGSAARVDDGKRGDVSQAEVAPKTDAELRGSNTFTPPADAVGKLPEGARLEAGDGEALGADQYRVVSADGKPLGPFRPLAADAYRAAAEQQSAAPASSAERASGSEPEGPGFESSAGDQNVAAQANNRPSIKDAKPLPFGPSSIIPRPIAEGKRLYRETNPEALDDILRVEGQPDSMRAFVTDNRDLAIGQGGNKGVMLTFRPDSLSGEVNPKPGTTPETGMEYRTDMRVGQALERIEMPQAMAKKLRGLSKRILARDFVRTDVGDQAVFTRKGDPLPAEATTERTEAGEQTVIPGAEQSEERSAEARKSGEKWEMEVRAKQSKMRTSTPQQEAGGLFDTQGDLLDSAPGEKPKSRAQTRLEDRLKREWTARENLPDSDEDGFMEATKRVQEARQALEAEAGPEAAKAALERIEAEYTPDVQKTAQKPAPVQKTAQPKDRIEDLGEKIGGARKDTATPTGPRAKKPKDERPASQRRYQVNQIAADAFNKDRVGKFTVSDTRSKTGRIPGFPRGALDFDTREEAEAAIPMVAVARNHRVVKQGDEYAIVRQVSDRKRPTVKGGFKTREEAMAYMAKNAEEIAETKLRIDDSIHPALEEAIRVGEDRRENNRDVAGQDFMDVFGFRGVEFGNWNNNAERQHLLNQAFDAFLDLAEITRMPPKALSLHGEMGLAFGARGHGLSGARAHYERDYGVINLTKIKGAGSLAHEWFHAMDHYFARQDGSAQPRKANAKEGEPIYDAKTPKEDYVSHGFLYKSGMREEVRNEIKNLMAAIMKRKAEYTEDQSTREKIEKDRIKDVERTLTDIEQTISTKRSYGKKKDPATKEQMQRFKRAALKIRAAKDLGEMVEAPSKARYSTFTFYEPVMEIADLYKEVMGRQAYRSFQGRNEGPAVKLQNAIMARKQAQQFLEDAKAEKVKEKTVRSEFYSEAWAMDQATAKDYWSTNHELAARAFESFVYDRLKDVDARNDFLSYEKRNDLPEYRLFNVKPYPEGQERKDINAAFERLFDVIQSKEDADSVMLYQREPLSEEWQTARASALAMNGDLSDLRAQLDKMGLQDVDLALASPDSTYQGALRIDRKGGMTMLIGKSLDPENTINHEAIHALRAMNLFTDREWRTLSQAAEGWMDKHSIADRYPDHSRLQQMEEAIAEEFAAWDGKGSGPFTKIKNFLSALGNFLRGRGFQTVDDIFDMTASGEIGKRGQFAAPEGMSEQRQDPFAAEFLQSLAEVDDIFAYPKSRATSLEGVMGDIDPMVEFIGETQTPEETGDAGADERFLLRSAEGKDFYVYQTDDEVWIDVSRLGEGEGGNAIYAAIGDYARNTGRTFIGDPAGLTDVALRRRTEAMLSSALKHGTTKHLEPHPYQKEGNEKIGVPPLRWTDGNDVANIQSLIEVATASLTSIVPEIENARFDFKTRTFRNSQGERLSDETLREISNTRRRVREAGAGHRTLKRGILYASLLRSESGKRPGLLEQLIRQPDQYVAGSDLSQTFYQRPPLSAQGRAQTAKQTNTAHIPSPGVYSASQQRTGALMRALSNVKGNVDDKIDRFRVLFQDQMIYLRRAEEMIAAHTGQEIDKADSAYYAEERYSGRVGYQLNDLKDRYVEPIAQMVGRNLDKLTLEDHKGQKREGAEAVSLYLWARHAKERNNRISDIQGGPSGSGLTDTEADAIMARAKASPGYGLMEKIGKLTDQLGAEMIDKRVEAGLLTKDEAATWKAQYKHYVPLKGFAETDMFDAVGTTPMAPRGRKFNVRGKESKMALGRDTESFDQLSNLIAQAEEVIVRAEKNIVGRTLYDLIQTNPAPGIWEVKDLETRRVYNKASGRVETQILNAAQVQMGPDEMAVKVDGEEKRIKFNDPRLARALGQLGVDSLGPVARVASYFSRYFSAVNTMLSPPFVIVNGFRDMVTAQFNLGQLPPGVRGKLRRKANPLSPAYWKSMAGAYSGLGKNPSQSEYAKWFREFEEAGAKVSFWNIENPQARKDTLERMIKNETGGKLRRGLRKGTRLNTDDNPALGWIERVNLMVDNATRLAVYAEARKNGMTKEEAASLSKNLTVNFNRRGELGASLNAWYPFANAAIQGSHVLLKAAKAKNVRQLIGGAFVLGFVNELQNAMRSGDEDDDGELDHDEIPNYVSERNFIIKLGGNERLTIPLPYGFNVPFYAGQQMAKVVRGVKPANEATAHTFAATFTSFSPISGEDVASTISPTLLDHVRELDKNENWQGRPIRPEQAYGDYGPQSYKEWSTYPLFGSLARGLNSATGGSPIEPGGIDISPEYMQHTFEFLGGGLWRFLNRSYETGRNVATGQEVEPHRIPLLRVLRYEPSDWLNQGRYFDFREEVMAAREAVKTAREISYPVKPEMLSASRLYGQLNSAEKARKAISSQMNAIYANDALTEREKREKVKPLQDQRNAIYVKFNREFVRTMGPQAE